MLRQLPPGPVRFASRGAYRLEGGCIPRSNIAPTFVWGNGLCSKTSEQRGGGMSGPLLVLGAAGSRRITSAILHVISGVIDRGMSLDEAVAVPRVHGLLSRKVHVERPAATAPLLRRLERRFREVVIKAPHSYSMGAVQAVQRGEDGVLVGMADPRRNGAAMGL